MTLDQIIDGLKRDKPFALSRFGDGEWECILGREGSNCDGHIYFPSMGVELAEIIKSNPPYNLSWHLHGDDLSGPIRDEVLLWCEMNGVQRSWGYTGVFHVAFKTGEDKKLIQLLKEKEDVVLVGPDYMRTAGVGDVHLTIPDSNCWKRRGEILSAIKKNIDNKVFLFAAGMPSCWLINQLYEVAPGKTFIDVGVLLDPYCGVMNRSFHRKYRTNENFC